MLQDDKLSSHDGDLDAANIREIYKEFGNNARAYMDLKFKHFATFSVLTTFLGTAVYQNRGLEHAVEAVSSLGFVAAILFWILDHRTGQYLRYYIGQARKFEERLIPSLTIRNDLIPRIPSARIAGASRITNVIFTVIIVAWASLFLTTIFFGIPSRLTLAPDRTNSSIQIED